MVSLFFFLCLIIAIIIKVCYSNAMTNHYYNGTPVNHDAYTSLEAVFFLLAFFSFLLILLLLSVLENGNVTSKIITLYEEENAIIEERINTIISEHMDYETDTYSKFKGEDAINLVSLFPELKSDTLVQKQIELYIDNNYVIKSLKQELLFVSRAKWYLYFGN